MRASRLSGWILIAMCTTAIAGTRTTVLFNQSTNACAAPSSEKIDGDKNIVEVSVIEDPQGKEAPAKKEITVRASAGNKEIATATIKEKARKLDPPLMFLVTTDVTSIRVGNDKSNCNFIVEAKDEDNRNDNDSSKPDLKPIAVAQAREYLTRHGILDHGKTPGAFSDTYRLYHLPDGTPAFPLPNKISEEDDVELWAVMVVGETVSAEITSCKEVPVARISGSRPEQLNPVKSKPDALAFQMQRLASPTRCAEELAYKLGTKYGDQEVSIKIAPVHLFSWGLAYGFDLGHPTRLRLVERPVEGGMGETERVIVRENDYAAFRPMVTLTLNVCRANPDDWHFCDWFGITAMADPGRLKEGGGLGLKVQPYPGLGVLIGMTLFQVDTFEPGHDLNVGDVFRQEGDLQIDKEFKWKSLGLFVGVGGDTDTVKKLF